MKTAYMFAVLMYMFVFQSALQRIAPIFQYADELFACFAGVALVLDIANRRKIGRENIFILICMTIVVLSGLFSSWAYQFQPLKIVLSDLIVVIKFFMTMYVGEKFFGAILESGEAKRFIRHHCIFIALMLVSLTVLDYVFDIFPWDERYEMRAIRLFYPHQTFLVAICVFIISAYAMFGQKRMRFVVLIPVCIVMAATLRAKAFGMIAAIIVMYIFSVKLKKRLNLVYIVLLAVGIYALVGDQIELYYGVSEEVSARSALNETSLRIAKDFFPFGTGFGTFGSHYSGVEYSPVYSLYRISDVWGLSEDMMDFISDTFWPMILGQFGVIGLVAYAGSIVILFLRIQRLARGNRYVYYGSIVAFIYLIISSTAESAFVNSMAVPLGWIIGVALSDKSYLSEPKKQAFIKTMKMRRFYKK